MGLLHTIDLVAPIDINDDATSMRESSLGKIAHAVQEMTQKRRSSGMVRGNESDSGARPGGVSVQS